MDINEKKLVYQLKENNVKAFESIFNKYYPLMVSFAHHYIYRTDICEEIVQDIFVKIWENADILNLRPPIKAYLTTMVKNRCIDYIRKSSIRKQYENEKQTSSRGVYNDEDYQVVEQIEKLRYEINKLPRQRKKIFKMSRYYGMKYSEIADKLNISYKTVENQMGAALKQIRKNVKHP